MLPARGARNVFEVCAVRLDIKGTQTAMTTLLITLLRRYGLYVMFVLVLACDSFRDDFIEPQNQLTFSQTDFYTIPGASVVIDLKSAIKKAYTPVSLTISSNPAKGTLTEIKPLILKYTPKPDFIEGEDKFVFSVTLDNGETLNTRTMTVIMKDAIGHFPCGVYAIEDFIHLKTPTTGAVHPLSNDRICNVDGAMEISIYLKPKFGEATVSGDSIIYVPGASFSDGDELVYRLSGADGKNLSYGVVSITRTRVEALNGIGAVDIFFVNDTIGFVAGGRSIYKTYDGGGHWSKVYDFGDEAWATSLQKIFFLDKDTGYATFTTCIDGGDENDDNDVICTGGWMRTVDGGLSWERFDLDSPTYSIFFISSSTGFISTARIDRWDVPVIHSILKTVDGGENWDAVVTYEAKYVYGILKLQFTNDNVGYAFKMNGIFRTTNAGQSWTSLGSNGDIVTASASPASGICISTTWGGRAASVTSPGTMVRSEDGFTWTPVRYFPYMIMQHDFSPSADIGIAVGISDPNPSIDPESHSLTISQSMDKGMTWTDFPDVIKGFPWAISVPSAKVAYILCSDKIIKVTP